MANGSRFDKDRDANIVLLTSVGEAWAEGGLVYRKCELNGAPAVLAMSVEVAQQTIAELQRALTPAEIVPKEKGTNGDGH